MSKTETPVADVAPAPIVAPVEHMMLEEFCTRLSKNAKRV